VSSSTTPFDDFVVTRSSALLRFAYALTGDGGLAEDLVQDALVKLHGRWHGGVVIERPEAYVRKAIVNAYVSWRRKRSSGELPGLAPETATADATDAHAERDLVWRVLADLPRRQRAVLVLRYYEGLADSEMAALLGCAEGTVRSLAARAFATLRAHPELAPESRPPTGRTASR
jgi:RNA polymerase sigma-70 factor (sigma-E family)